MYTVCTLCVCYYSSCSGGSGQRTWHLASALQSLGECEPPSLFLCVGVPVGGLCLWALGEGHHWQNTLLLWASPVERPGMFFTFVHTLASVHVFGLPVHSSAGEQKMGVRWPVTLTTCLGLWADHPHFRLKDCCASLGLQRSVDISTLISSVSKTSLWCFGQLEH